MKILILTIAMIFSSVLAYAGINDGLVVYYPFDGNAGSGTVYGATLTADRLGNLNSAYTFDGNDYIDYGNSGTAGDTEITISLWVKFAPYSNTIDEPLIRKWLSADGGWCSYGLWRGAGNSIVGTVQNITLNQYPGWITVDLPQDYQWHHIVFIYNKQDPVNNPWDDGKIFIDSASVNTSFEEHGYNHEPAANFTIEYVEPSYPNMPHPLYVARKTDGVSSNYYQGGLDDIRIYNRALSDTEIQELYNPLTTTTTTTTKPSGPCAAETIYGDNSEQTELLRKYRDNVLSKTAEGREIIKTYYKFSPIVTKLLEQRLLLKNRAKTFIDGMLPEIRRKVEESNNEP